MAGVKLCKLRYARSALGPCHKGRARAQAATNGRPRFGGTAGRGPFGSSSWDNGDERFGLRSRRSPLLTGLMVSAPAGDTATLIPAPCGNGTEARIEHESLRGHFDP